MEPGDGGDAAHPGPPVVIVFSHAARVLRAAWLIVRNRTAGFKTTGSHRKLGMAKPSVIQPLTLDVAAWCHRRGRPVGCGKSTLLRMVAGLERVTSATSGSIVNGWPEDEPKRSRHHDGVPRATALYPHMSVGREHGAGAEIRRHRYGIDRRAARSSALRGWTVAGAPPAGLFRRPAPRVAMGRAIVRDPAVFLRRTVAEPSTPSCASARCVCNCSGCIAA